MDFYRIREHAAKSGVIEVYPEFLVGRSRDIMIQAKTFVAIWDQEAGLWSADEYDVARLVDAELDAYFEKNKERLGFNAYVKHMRDFSSGIWTTFKSWMSKVADNAHTLNQTLVFADSPVRKEDYASKRLPYSLEDEFPESWDKLIGKLYSPQERAKIEWAIGAVVSGDSKNIQKFLVLYGEKGTGKSTVLDVVQSLFKGYYTVFEAKALGSNNAQFATESFKNSPLVAIQHDGDLSRIEDNTRLNSIISHEEMVINEKNKPLYNAAVNAFLFMGSNHPVKITDAKSGIIRRLIDATPTGERFDINTYEILTTDIQNHLGAVANHCLKVYREMGKHYYRDYIPMTMLQKTDMFYNFVEYSALDFIENDPVTLSRAWDKYRDYVSYSNLPYSLSRPMFREALRDYFAETKTTDKGETIFSGFKKEKLQSPVLEKQPEIPYSLTLDQTESLLDEMLKECPAQYSSEKGTPSKRWDDVTTKLEELDTSKEHYVRVPPEHIVVDFDLRDESGDKSAVLNLEAASKWPPTYAEYSRGGAGVHLHYLYDGDPSELMAVYSPGIEIKVFNGKSSLRRRLSACNNIPVAHISEGLPLKEKKVINKDYVADEQHIRDMVARNLRKEIHPATKPSIDFIKKILDDAYESGVPYDVSDMKPSVLAFATQSTNQANACLKAFAEMKFTGKGMEPDEISQNDQGPERSEDELVFFDVEVYPNLFLVCYKRAGDDHVDKLVNPTPENIEALMEFPLVGFNNRRYDNHILYARYMGASNEELFRISSRIVNGDRDAMFANAYNISYTDIYDFSTKKQSLKLWEIDLGLTHLEMDIPWDKPVEDKDRQRVIEYCENDVRTTEALFHHLEEDWTARKILSEIAGLTPNATTNTITQQIIFGDDPNPPFVWTDLSEAFPGYKYEFGKSTYRGEIVGEGGYVYAEPGYYENVALLDVESMHPTSAIELGIFGPYTENFKELRDGRFSVKHMDKDAAAQVLDGKLVPYLSDDKKAMKSLSNAMKLPINSTYGLTSAKFPTRANGRDPKKNPDNIVAKRGALFMVDLKHYIQEQGFTVAHIKTDSVKIPNATPEIIQKVVEFGKRYGYNFDHEATYEKMCLVNDAVYIAKDEEGWHATGAQFQHPVVFKTLFSREPIDLEDFFETRSVRKSHIYLNYGDEYTEIDSDLVEFIGRVGQFAPVKENGARLMTYRGEPEGDGYIRNEYNLKPVRIPRWSSVSRTKGWLWQPATRVKSIEEIDLSYSAALVDAAKDAIGEYTDIEAFVA